MIRPALPLLIVALVALGGCGGGSSGDDASAGQAVNPSERPETVETSSLSKTEYIEKAEEICSKGTENLLEEITNYMNRHASSNQTKGELTAEAIQATVLPKFQVQVDELRNLGAPAGDEEEIEAFLEAMQHGVDSLSQRNELAHITDLDRELQLAGELALDYGIVNCAN